MRRFLAILLAAVAYSCGPSQPTHARTSASPPSSPAPASSFCPRLQPDHPLVIAYLGEDISRAVVRDVHDPNRGVTLCALPAGAPRFVSATKVAMLNQGGVSILDLETGASSQFASLNDPVDTVDWSSDGSLFAYGSFASDMRSINFHLIAGGQDRILATIASASPISSGTTRIEFSPRDDYVAMGAAGPVSSGDHASVQVRRVDGTLVFSSAGTGQLTWAGESPKLYFQGSAGVETWDPAKGVAALAVTSWLHPIRSAGGRWLAYFSPQGELRLVDTRTGTERSVGLGTQAAWVTSALIFFNRVVSCPTPPPGFANANPCITQAVIYDMTDGTLSASALGHVFSSWPKSSPSWS